MAVAIGHWQRPAGISPELVLAQWRNRSEKPVLRIKGTVAKVVIREGMVLVAAGACDYANNAPGQSAELGVEVAGQHAELMESIGVREQVAPKLNVVVEGAIKIKSGAARDAVYCELGACARSSR